MKQQIRIRILIKLNKILLDHPVIKIKTEPNQKERKKVQIITSEGRRRRRFGGVSGFESMRSSGPKSSSLGAGVRVGCSSGTIWGSETSPRENEQVGSSEYPSSSMEEEESREFGEMLDCVCVSVVCALFLFSFWTAEYRVLFVLVFVFFVLVLFFFLFLFLRFGFGENKITKIHSCVPQKK